MTPSNVEPTGEHHLAIVIPAYNEADTIGELIRRVPPVIDAIAKITILVIDDGSSDDTARVAREAGATVISHRRNMGLASTFRTSIRSCLESGATLAVSVDADLQFDPGDIPKLIEPVLRGEADFVAADRFSQGGRPAGMPRIKYYGNLLMTRVVSVITGEQFSDVSSGYRAYSRESLLHLNVQSSFTYTQESFIELAAKGFAIAQVPVSVRYYSERESRIVSSVTRYAVRTFLTIARTTRDYAPLTIFGWLATIITVPGILLGLFVLGHYLSTGSFSPYIFLAFASVYLFTCGMALFILGLVADMLRGTRINQERLLYFSKIRHYEESSRSPDDNASV